MSKRLLGLLLMLQSSTLLAQTADPAEITVTMGDDGAVNVPLEFDFPLYGQLFSESWMYDNGIISFLQPGSPGSISPWQWSAQPLAQSNGNYYIAALWADIAPTSLTKYTYQGDATFMKYTWTNIAEYYSAWDPQPRYSTFSTTIKPDGSISTSFASINLQTSSIASGIVGNRAAGEVQQYYYSGCCSTLSTGGISDWSYLGTYVPPEPPPPEPPIVQEPEPVYVPPAAEETPIVEEPVVQQTVQTVAADPVVEATKPIQAVQETTATTATLEIVANPVSAALSPDKKAINIDAQSIARNNQRNLAALTDSVVSSSIQGSLEAGALSAETSLVGGTSSLLGGSSSISSVSVSSTDSSSTQTQSSSTQSTKITSASVISDTFNAGVMSSSQQDISAQNQNNVSQSGSTGGSGIVQATILPPAQYDPQDTVQDSITSITANSLADTLALFKPMNGSSSEALFGEPVTVVSDDYSYGISTISDIPPSSITDDINPLSIRSLASISPPMYVVEEPKKEADSITDSQDPAIAELAASGAKIEAIQVVPIGYFNYLNLAYKDVAFYKERAIYRKQKVVDNLRLLRLLNARNDINYNKMLEGQYNLQDM